MWVTPLFTRLARSTVGRWVATGFVATLLPGVAHAQAVPPFYSGATTAYDAVPGVVNAGAILGAQVAVSADRKYVTIGSNTGLSALNSLQPFTFAATSNAGFVGIGNTTPTATGTGTSAARATVKSVARPPQTDQPPADVPAPLDRGTPLAAPTPGGQPAPVVAVNPLLIPGLHFIAPLSPSTR
jgi:hypothetical protein